MHKLFRVGEISKIFHIPIKTLRYYDEIELLKPAHIDTETNYRYYSIDQFVLIDIIQNSKKMGMPLRDIKKSIDSEIGVEGIVTLVDNQLKDLDNKILELNNLRDSMQEVKNILEDTLKYKKDEPFILEEEEIPYISYPFSSKNIEEQEINFRRAALSESSINMKREVYAVFGVSTDAKIYFETNTIYNPDIRYYPRYKNQGEEYEIAPAGKYACIIFDDNSFSKDKYYKILADFIKQQELKPMGDFIEEWIMPRVEDKKESTIIKLEIRVG